MYDPEDPPGVRWVSVDDLIAINDSMIERYTPGEQRGVKQPDMLESAQHAPSVHRYYDQTEDVFILAAVLMSRLVKNHPFHNANKRTAFGASIVFLEANGYKLDPPRDETLLLMEELAAAHGPNEGYSEAEVAGWLADNAMLLPEPRAFEPTSLVLHTYDETRKPE